MEINEEDLSKRLLEIEYIRREVENYINALNALQMTQESLTHSLLGLSGLKGGQNKEIMVPYSQDIFFRGVLSDTSLALVNIGSNIFRNLSMQDLKAKLEKDLEEVEKNVEQIAEIIQKLQEEGSKLEREANEMYRQYNTALK